MRGFSLPGQTAKRFRTLARRVPMSGDYFKRRAPRLQQRRKPLDN